MPKKPIKPQDDINWDAAISGAAVKAVTQSRSVSRRKRKPTPQAQSLHNIDNVHSLIPSKNVLIGDGVVTGESLENIGLGDRAAADHIWTAMELDFLAIYLKGNITIDKAMISAGYADLSQQARYNKAKSIVKAYASGVGDKAQIFRDVGLSEVEVANNIKKLIEDSRSDQVKLNALALAAKCLRLTDEPAQTHQGVRINIYTGAPPSEPGQAPPERPNVTVNTQIVQSTKPLQITK